MQEAPLSVLLSAYLAERLGHIRLHVILHHILVQGNHVVGMKSFAVGIKEGHDVDDRDLRISCCVF
jgi:hypothetical protein